jgi:hypothetical protein
LPRVLLITLPPIVTMPWLSKRGNGSGSSTMPMSMSTFWKKRA